MQTTVYIRKDNEDFWLALGKEKSDFVNAMISEQKGVVGAIKSGKVTYTPPAVTVVKTPIKKPEIETTLPVKGRTAKIDQKDVCLRHHVPKAICVKAHGEH